MKFTDEKQILRLPGTKWVVKGPVTYIPPIEVKIIKKLKSIPLDENEGIYVKDMKTGTVKLIKGPQTYSLGVDDVLWEKPLDAEAEAILASNKGEYIPHVDDKYEQKAIDSVRDKTKAVVFNAPHNSIVQIFDYRSEKLRYVFGPGKVILEPYEEVTIVSLSAGIPKKEGVIKNIAMMLGPDFITDEICVETLDHAKLRMRMSYNWQFECDRNN